MIEDIALSAVVEKGVLGILLGWFMFRMEKVINNNTKVLTEVKVKVESCPAKKGGK